MRHDFATIDDSHSFLTVPPGEHACQVADIRVQLSREGHPRWGLHWKVLQGPLAGKTAAWDNLTWSEKGLPRVKHVLGALGFDVTGVLDLEPEDLLGKCALVQVEREEYEAPGSGRRIERLTVPYHGYQPLPEDLFGGPLASDAPAGKSQTEEATHSDEAEDDLGSMPF
ncbi:MAG: hypothetical protein H6830_06375 [Planctomycetes bacterium]|nr:hypothetical protein [Planctomycetota bacterium]MCB9910930.1 hypothetical protein [Planctomycetota bacterium]MCB9911603.1 hypothetical protein [Planctomycetota bacterium]HRV80673.1 hypothetical protein [Planctomycetota bacterium]